VDQAILEQAMIPWQNRAVIGRWRALSQTVLRATFQTATFCRAVAMPVDLISAQRFRHLLVGMLFLIGALVSAIIAASYLRSIFYFLPEAMFWLIWVLWLVPWWLFLEIFTALHTYWLHPAHLSIEKQNRAVALGHYACAPLYLAIEAAILAGGAFLVLRHLDMPGLASIVLLGGGLLVLAAGMGFWRICLIMNRQVAQRSALGQCLFFVFHPLGILAAGAITVLLCPLAIGYALALMVSLMGTS